MHVIPGGVENIDIYPTKRECVEDDCRCPNYVADLMSALKMALPNTDASSAVLCRVCGGSGWVAVKQSIDDGYGEVDACPACDNREGKHGAR